MAIILLDVDGTLVDSRPGINEALLLTLDEFGIAHPDEEFLISMCGPPIEHTLASIGAPEEAVGRYRHHYREVGIAAAPAYPGIPELLGGWKDQGHLLCTATSKPLAPAEAVLDHTGLGRFIDIVGATSTHTPTKEDVIAQVLKRLACPYPQRVEQESIVLIGDRSHDVAAARAVGIPVALVTWGYGNPTEWATADATITTVEELQRWIP